jgi:alanine racemase
MNSENVYRVATIENILQGELIGDKNLPFRSLSIDSRNLLVPEENLFFALLGDRHDGHDYISDLYQKGVRAFVISRKEFADLDLFPDAAFFVVDDTLKALQKLAAWHRENYSFPIIGITGSNGKTIVKEWLYQLLNEDYKIVRSPKSYNSQVGVPLSIWNMSDVYDLGIFEAGISQPNEMQNLSDIIQADIGFYTHLGQAHQENFENTKQKLQEKVKLFRTCKQIFFCSDHNGVEEELRKIRNAKLISWSRKQKADFQILSEKRERKKTLIEAVYEQKTKLFFVPFSDKASIDNAILCILYLLSLGYKDDSIQEKVDGLEALAMRLELKEGIADCTIINDYYNSDLASLEIALDLMNQQQTDKKKTLILSDILQTGFSAKKLYKAVAQLLEQKQIDRIIGVGNEISSQGKCFTVEKSFYQTSDLFLKDLNRNLFQNEIILIKGARDFHFERISNALQYKAHRTVLEVNLTAMVHNLNYFRSLLNPSTKLVVMVKAFSYGSGSTEIANLLQYHRVDYLAVAIADEGVELRNSGISIPIMVMNPEPHSFDTMIEYSLEPEIYNLSILKEFQSALQRNSVKKYPIHIKLDTGMHRLGFVEENLKALEQEITENDLIHVKSVFSHLAGADEEQHDDYTLEQIQKFTQWSDRIQAHFSHTIDRHILNSAGIERFPQAQFEMVRLGIGLYGVSAAHQENLQNVSSLKTTISQIKTISREQTIGYGRKGVLQKNTRIGIIPIGYADGFNRHLSNGRGKVLINGNLCPIVGNICMDMSMIDITNVDAKEGDTVVIFGDDYPVYKLSEQLDTIPYEILTTVSRRVKRVYVQE